MNQGFSLCLTPFLRRHGRSREVKTAAGSTRFEALEAIGFGVYGLAFKTWGPKP